MSTQTTRPLARAVAVLIGALGLVLLMIPGSDAQGSTIVINELQPRNSTTILDGDDDSEDWIELRNTTNADIDIAGWRIEDSSAQWIIPTDPLNPSKTIVPANGFLLIWASDKGDPAEPGFPGPADELHANFKLGGEADSVTLINGFTLIDTVSYDVPAGFGQDESYGRNAAGDFVVFTPSDVTPLAANGAVSTPTPTPTPTPTAIPGPASIVINEVMQANTLTIADDGGNGQFEDWFELFNPTCETVDMTGWSVRDSAESWQLPDGTTMAPGDVLFLWASNKGDPDNVDEFPGPAGELHTSFRLSAEGEDLFLLDDAGLLIATVNPGASVADESFGLTGAGTYATLTGAAITPDGLNPDQALPVCTPTPTPTPTATPTATPTPTTTPTPDPGEPTATPTPTPTSTPTPTPTVTPEDCAARSVEPSIVINEAQPRNSFTIRDGDGDFSGWIELYNPTDTAVDVSGWRLVAERVFPRQDIWQLPEQVTIASGEYVLIWASGKSDPANPDFPGPDGELHASFLLDGSRNDPVKLYDADYCLISLLGNLALENDESRGLTGETLFRSGRFDVGYATPGGPNGPQGLTVQECTSRTAVPSIVINEAQSRNTFTFIDGDGDFRDWIELFNPTDATVDISGWLIRDTANQWRLPFLDPTTGTRVPGQVTIASGEYLLIWASGKGLPDDPDFPGPEGEFHTQFRLNADEGELLSITDFDGCVRDELNLPPLEIDESFGLTEDGTPGTFDPLYATPLEPNGPQGLTAAECAARVASQGIQINEAQSRNSITIADGDGDFSDWIELYNPTDTSVDISGWVLRDTFSELQFPFAFNPATGDWIPEQATLASGEYLMIWASGKADPDDEDFPGPEGEIHTTFRLSGSEGEALSIEDFEGCVIDAVALPPLSQDESFGRTDDGTDGVFDLYFQTPSEGNRAQSWPIRSTCYAPASDVRINRLVARNDGLLIDGDGDDSDFIELLNTGPNAVDISLWQLRDESDWSVIPDGTVVPAGETLVLWASGKGDVLDSDYPGPAGEIHLTFRLAGGGEQITFAEPSECIVEQFTYPELLANQAYGYDALGQRAVLAAVSVSTVEPVTCAVAGSVQIVAISAKNDVDRPDEDGDFGDWLELSNTTDQAIDLGGWILTDDANSWVVPNGVVVSAGSTLLVWADEKDRGDADTPLHASFRLSAGGETVSVSSSPDCPVDVVTYPEVEDDQVYRRVADGSFALQGGAPDTDDSDEPEAGAISVSGTCIAINEVMAKNDGTLEDEDGELGDWIELANLSADTIDLSGYAIADFSDSWVLPDGVEIEAGGFLIIWADEGDRGEAGEELHTNFKLGSGGELITLSDPDGEIVARMSSYPELDDDESFGINADGDYVVFEAGDATPGQGPTGETCDFEISVANATAAEDDSEQPDSQDDADVVDAADAADAAEAEGEGDLAADDPQSTVLATTGTSTRLQSLLAQLLILSGSTLVLMARIAHRRSRD